MFMDWPASCGPHGPGDLADRDRIIANDLRRHTKLGKIARHGKDEGIVVIDDEDRHASPSSKTVKIRAALSKVS